MPQMNQIYTQDTIGQPRQSHAQSRGHLARPTMAQCGQPAL